jgi:ankyrin repeat protein
MIGASAALSGEGKKMAKVSKTAWFNAAKSWDYVAIKSMLKEAPEFLEVTDSKGLNALHMACAVKPGKDGVREPNGLKTVAMLLDAGIDVETIAFTDQDGGEWRANAVWFATGRGQNLPLVKLLLRRGGDPSHSLFTVLWGYKPEFARELVKYKPRMNLRSGDGRTALHAAAVPDRLEVLELYLDAGADPRIKDNAGITPLDLAKKRRVPKEFIERMEGRGG